VPRPPTRLDDAVLDVDPFDVEQIAGVVLGNLSHAELGEQVDAGIQGDVAHAGPYGDQPRLGKLQFLGQGARSLWARVRDRIAYRHPIRRSPPGLQMRGRPQRYPVPEASERPRRPRLRRTL